MNDQRGASSENSAIDSGAIGHVREINVLTLIPNRGGKYIKHEKTGLIKDKSWKVSILRISQ